MENCINCPRGCPAGKRLCGNENTARVARVQLHYAEEPCISGTNGSGTVFFAGCNMRCVFCQNYKISTARPETYPEYGPESLCGLFFELQKKGAHNINLVTPTPHIKVIREALLLARAGGLPVPVIWNTSAYETVQAIRLMEGLADVYLPDLKYCSAASGLRYSGVSDYWDAASSAVLEMARQTGEAVFNGSGLIQKGLIVRHLILPSLRKESMELLNWIRENLPDTIYVSLLAQYFPEHRAGDFPEINRRITKFEYDSVLEHFWKIGLRNGYQQKRDSAVKEYVPEF